MQQKQQQNYNYYQIESKCAGRVLDICQEGQNKGKLIIYDRWNSGNQHFAIIHTDNLQVMFMNKKSGLFLTILYDSDKNGAIIGQEPFKNIRGQKFRLQSVKPGSGQYIIFTYSGKVLDLCQNNYKNNTRIIQWQLHSKDNQKWLLRKVN